MRLRLGLLMDLRERFLAAQRSSGVRHRDQGLQTGQASNPARGGSSRVNTEAGGGLRAPGLVPDVALKKLKLAIEEDDSYAAAHARIAYVYAL